MITKSRFIVIKEITYYHGEKVTCVIRGRRITDAKISLKYPGNNSTAYICQNDYDGASNGEKLGYMYQWATNRNSSECENLTKTKNNDCLGDIVYTILDRRR